MTYTGPMDSDETRSALFLILRNLKALSKMVVPSASALNESLEQAELVLVVHGTTQERALLNELTRDAQALLEQPSELHWSDWFARIERLLAKIYQREIPSTNTGEPALRASAPPLPRMFLGSSTEGLRLAQAIQAELEHDVECTIWSQGVFGLSDGTLDGLLAAGDTYQWATLILTADDVINKRGWMSACARDNVLFELGFFMGRLGRPRVFVVRTDETMDVPTDLAGVTLSRILRRSDGNVQAAVGPTCSRIRAAISLVSSVST